jgi:diguanylate cyclase (GGDEF)-like protein
MMSDGSNTSEDAKRTMLIVDDDDTIRKLLKNAFTDDYRVLCADDGESALALAANEPVDVILADHMMPGITGVELLAKAIEVCPDAVRILITASDQIEDARKAINVARVSRFVSKPMRMGELREIVAGAVREADLERENRRLLRELREKNELLQRALSLVQEHERSLERKVDERTRELKTAMAKLEELSLRDGLTGLYNHRYFQEALGTELARSARHSHECGLLFIDVDHFKNYNDMAGHQAGDDLLRQLAKILMNTGEVAEVQIRGRVSDIAARYGGEEFVVILPETSRGGAAIRAQRLRDAIRSFPFLHGHVQPGGCVTVSIGVAMFPEDALQKEDLIEKADQALLRAKRAGRDRVMVAGE